MSPTSISKAFLSKYWATSILAWTNNIKNWKLSTIWSTTNQRTWCPFSKISWSWTILMNFLSDLILSMNKKSDFHDFMNTMHLTNKIFIPITSRYCRRRNRFSKTSIENKDSKKKKKPGLKSRTNKILGATAKSKKYQKVKNRWKKALFQSYLIQSSSTVLS